MISLLWFALISIHEFHNLLCKLEFFLLLNVAVKWHHVKGWLWAKGKGWLEKVLLLWAEGGLELVHWHCGVEGRCRSEEGTAGHCGDTSTLNETLEHFDCVGVGCGLWSQTVVAVGYCCG